MSNEKILVVEDDAIIADDVRHSLERLGYDVIDTAATGEDAIKKTAILKPDLVLMDIILKGQIDGIKAAGHIINHFDVPVVYLTSHSDRATIKRARETGPFGYLMKPFEEKDMAATLEMALYKHCSERRLKQNEQWLTIILRSIGDAVIVTDASGAISFMNPGAERLLRARSEGVIRKPRAGVFRLVDEKTREPLGVSVKAFPDAPGESADSVTYQGALMVLADGGEIPVKCNASPIRNDKGEITGVVVILSDETEARSALKTIEKSERFLSTIFDSIHDPFCIYDSTLRIVRANASYADAWGKPLKEIIGFECRNICDADIKPCDTCVVQRTIVTRMPASQEVPRRMADGSEGWYEYFTHPIFDESGAVSHVIEHMRDITARKLHDEERRRLITELEYLSRVDPLTGLLNRRALLDFLTQEVDRARRYKRSLCLMLCDIDHFKQINDTYGHSVGDEALVKTARALKDFSRKADVVGRYGGDEIMVIMPESTMGGAMELAERFREALDGSHLVPESGQRVRLTLSIGVASFKPGDDTTDSIISRSDAALYEAKRQGRNRVIKA